MGEVEDAKVKKVFFPPRPDLHTCAIGAPFFARLPTREAFDHSAMELDILRRPGAGDGAIYAPAPPPLLHVSRHFLGAAPACMRSLPFPPASGGPSHRLLAMGTWKQDAEQYRLSVFDLQVGLNPVDGSVTGAVPEELTSWVPPGRVTALATATAAALGPAPPGPGGEPRGACILLATTARGALCRLRLGLPLTPGAGPGDVDLLGLGVDCADTDLVPWLWPGGEGGGGDGSGGPSSAALTAVDAAASAPAAVVASADGSLSLVRLDTDGAGRALSVLAPPRRGASLCAVRFVGGGGGEGGGLVAAAGVGGLELWDGRAASPSATPAPAARARFGGGGGGSPASWPFADGRPTCLATHPAVPYLIAAGGGGGVVALWDVRGGRGSGGGGGLSTSSSLLASPASTATAPSASTIWDVTFDPASSGGRTGVLFVTEAGELAGADLGGGAGGGGGGGGGAPVSVLHSAPSAGAVSLDAGPGGAGSGADLFVATDSECLLYVRRGGLGS